MADSVFSTLIAQWLVINGYSKYKNPNAKGVVRHLYEEYDVSCRFEVSTTGIFGEKHSIKDTSHYGKVYAWTSAKTNYSYNTVKLVNASDANADLFSVAMEPLGGKKEYLGW